METNAQVINIAPEKGRGLSPDVVQNIERIYNLQQANRWRIANTTAKERIAKLKKLNDAIWARRAELHEAIYQDYRKNPAETNLTEIYPSISEIKNMIRHLPKWMKPKRVGTPLVLFGTHSQVRYEPKGLVLILSPWNYPFQLLVSPLAAAIAAGNCCVIKPSSKVPKTAAFIKKFLDDLFPEEEVATFEGSSNVANALLDYKFDHIFFTGSPPIGKKIMEAAAKHLTPVTLELGGKSPVILDETADVRMAAERIMWGKFINAGQTCVAPDYLLIHESKHNQFVAEAKKVINARYGETEEALKACPDFARMVSEGNLSNLRKILDESVRQGAVVECGGFVDVSQRYLAPTLLSNVKDESAIMKEEIFGPILPIIKYRNLSEAFEMIHRREKPLALYIFSENRGAVETILKNTTAGGSCVNSLIIHLANHDLPFGGVGYSGMGNYHGFYGFKAFSHERAVLSQKSPDSLKMFYPPYTKKVKKMIEIAMRFLT